MKRSIKMLCSCLFAGMFVMVASAFDDVKGWQMGQAEWMHVQINESFDYDQAFETAVEILSDKYEMGMIKKDGGYVRTAWNFYRKTRGTLDKKVRIRITLKFNDDRTQVAVKTEVQKLIFKEWVDGYSNVLGYQVRKELQDVLQ
ncbi:MAG: hypothetical protein K5660_08165 [Paludibacteraceae bacterium]|nr:hypothetical protein [Paludibacteraceae bacterium]